MQGRRHLEKFLTDAISYHDNDLGVKMIDLIQKEMAKKSIITSNDASLEHFNDKQESFLSLAIKEKMEEIANKLFKMQINSPGIIFGKNDKNETLIHCAASNGSVTMLEKLIHHAKQQHENEADHQHWLHADNQGNTPLHTAMSSSGPKITEILLGALNDMPEAEAIEFINRWNEEGDTALHLAARATRADLVCLLIEAGASWLMVNNKGQSPLDHFLNLSQPAQINMLRHLEPDPLHPTKKNQRDFLQLYQAQLLNQDRQTASLMTEKNYYILAASISLRDLVLAHLEIKQDMPLRNSYTIHKRDHEDEMSANNQDRKTHQQEPITYLTTKIDMPLPNEIKIKLPGYQARLYQAERAWRKKNTSLLVESDDEDNDIHQHWVAQEKKELLAYEQVNNDRSVLVNLIQDIEAYLADLENNPRISRCHRTLSILIPVLSCLVYVGVEAWFIYERNVVLPKTPCEYEVYNPSCTFPDPLLCYFHDRDTRCNFHEHYVGEDSSTLKTLLFGLLGGVGSVLSFFGLRLWKVEAAISANEWKKIITALRESVIIKLEALNPDNLAQTTQQDAWDLKEELNKLYDNQARQNVIDIFKRIDAILKSTLSNLNHSAISFGLFKPVQKSEKAIDDRLDANDVDVDVTPEETRLSLAPFRNGRRQQ